MTDLWLYNKIKDLESSGSGSAEENVGQLDTYFALMRRYDQYSGYSYQDNNVRPSNTTGLNAIGYHAIGAGNYNGNHYNDRFWELPAIQSCNVTDALSASVMYEKTYMNGWTSNNYYTYPNHGVRVWAVENTSDQQQSYSINYTYSSYSTYSGYGLYGVFPSFIADRSPTDPWVGVSVLTIATGTSSTYTTATSNVNIPANTVMMFFLITSDYYLGKIYSSQGPTFSHHNGLLNLENAFTNTALKPRNDFVREIMKGGLIDDSRPTYKNGPVNYWNKLVASRDMQVPAAYSHLE